jgi:A nuclease family of the HNH/ENDO VII superfamily with conserved AHH
MGHLKLAPEKEKAVLARDREYRSNGYRKIKGNSGKKGIYGKLGEIGQALLDLRVKPSILLPPVKQGSAAHARRYTFGRLPNFRVGWSPYANQAHHLLPEELLGLGYIFNDKQHYLLRQIAYDINNGDNIIFLPEAMSRRLIHRLPSHNGSHPSYTRRLKASMRQVKDSLNAAISKDKKHENWDPPTDVKQMLLNAQDDFWSYVSNAGPVKIGDVKPW